MAEIPGFRDRRRELCLAVALLLPVPVGVASVQVFSSPVESTKTAYVAAPTVEAALGMPSFGHEPAASAPALPALDPRVKRKVITKSKHERILEISANTSYDVPLAALEAYQAAASTMAWSDPSCNLSWGVVAAIGQVESNHGRFGGTRVLDNGKTFPIIVGRPLNGAGGVGMVRDTDNGRLDGDKVWDRAVGPMQFIPSTWIYSGVDGDGDGVRDPSDFDDAAQATARYLCSGDGNFSSLRSARAAVYRYNRSHEYVDLVLRIANVYDSGVVDVVPNDDPPRIRPRQHRRYRDDPTSPRSPAPDQLSPTDPTNDPGPTTSTTPPKTTTPTSPPPTTAAPPPTTTTPPPTTTTPTTPTTTTPTQPVYTDHTGTLTRCDPEWCLDGAALNLGTGSGLATVQADYDGDGVAEPVSDELSGLSGGTATVTLDTAGLVVKIQGLDYQA